MIKYNWLENGIQRSKEWSLEKHLAELGLDISNSSDIYIIDCPRCAAPSYYDGGFTDFCSCCGYFNLADHSEEAMTLSDHWERCYEIEELFGKEGIKEYDQKRPS